MAHTLTIPEQTTPCFSPDPAARVALTELFDSTDLLDHREAARLCADCPFAESCGELALSLARGPERWAGVPSGTWAGVLFREGRPVNTRRRS